MKAHFDLYPNFEAWEFKCPCCSQENMQHDFMKKLQKARDIANVPFKILSGYRCERYNNQLVADKRYKASPDSSHKKGIACDVEIKDSTTRYKIMKAMFDAGFKRMGEKSSFVHVDTDCEKPQIKKWGY